VARPPSLAYPIQLGYWQQHVLLVVVQPHHVVQKSPLPQLSRERLPLPATPLALSMAQVLTRRPIRMAGICTAVVHIPLGVPGAALRLAQPQLGPVDLHIRY
jgi:hypothetical protein